MNSLIRYCLRLALCLMAGLFVSGCATMRTVPESREVSLVLRGLDRVDMDGREMTADRVARWLRSRIATDTMIKVERGAGVSGEAMAHLVGRLQQDGFTRVVFVTERHIEVDVP